MKQLVWPLDESQGPSQLHSHGPWLGCEMVVTYQWFALLLSTFMIRDLLALFLHLEQTKGHISLFLRADSLYVPVNFNLGRQRKVLQDRFIYFYFTYVEDEKVVHYMISEARGLGVCVVYVNSPIITLFRSITMVCGIDNILWNILTYSHNWYEYREYFVKYC